MKVNIIIPTYNAGERIEYAIKSARNQVTPTAGIFDTEIIVVDDGSTDNTIKKCIDLGVDRIIKLKHSGGPNQGRNKGLELATCDYIAFLDQDDIWMPNKLYEQIFSMIKYKCSASFTSYKIVGKRKTINKINIHGKYNKGILQDLIEQNGKFHIIPSTIVFANDWHGKSKFWGISSDIGFMIRLFYMRSVYVCSDILVYKYNNHSNLSYNIDYKLETIEDFKIANRALYPRLYNSDKGLKKLNGIVARNYYFQEKPNECREYLMKSQLTIKNIYLYIISFSHAIMRYTNKKFNILGK